MMVSHFEQDTRIAVLESQLINVKEQQNGEITGLKEEVKLLRNDISDLKTYLLNLASGGAINDKLAAS